MTTHEIMQRQLDTAHPTVPFHVEPDVAFRNAICTGRLSTNMRNPLYAGNYMYMGDWNGKHQFKNIITREYLA